MKMQVSKVAGRAGSRILLAAVLMGCLGGASVYGFVISCEEEIAQAYPSALKADLGACSDPAARVVPSSSADVAKFTNRLNGTWTLRSRTIQGIAVQTETRTSKLYFDLDSANGQVSGAALLLDGNKDKTVKASDSFAGFWNLSASRQQNGRIVLSMAGQSVGSYAHVRARESEQHEFFEQDNVFVSTFGEGEMAGAWDRIVVMENSLTFISCTDGVVERFVKVSGQKPTVEGASIQKHWQDVKDGRKVATVGTSATAFAKAARR